MRRFHHDGDYHAHLSRLHERRKLRRHQRPPKRLRHQLFMSFGLAILLTMLCVGAFSMFIWTSHTPRPLFRILTFFIAGNVLWMFSGALAHRLAWPLWELSRAVKDFGSGKLDRRVQLPQRSPQEVAELAGTFNDMAAQVEALVQGQRELLGVVSHELRTPLARLRVLLALLQDREGDPALIAKFEREIVEMDALVGELLAEARISAGALTLRVLDLGDVVSECAERLGLTLAAAPSGMCVNGDPTLISRAMTLLLDNAHKHGGHNVRVRASVQETFVRVCVEDDGPGFEAEDLPKLFAAFARGRGKEADEKRGVGLGLYLVRRIAEAHGGSAFAENLPEGGACVGCLLPRATSAA
ncbi:MAG: HAMP domain-containing sensor histidine kinase [Polyangiales bacterium]